MADHIDKKELEGLDVVPYDKVRPKIKSGDLIFCSGRYKISGMIQGVTKSPWSHVGIIFNLSYMDRVLVLESVEDIGVRFVPISKYLYNYDRGRPYRGMIVVAGVRGLNKDTVKKIAKQGMDYLSRPYDDDEIIKIVGRIFFGRGRHKRDKEYICSELVAECFEQGGLPFQYDKRGFISPENIWCDEKVYLRWRIR